jgi:Protein of unknown function (DUF3995)
VTRSAASTRAAATVLTGLAALHVVWATGSPWPASDRDALADAAAGQGSGSVPSPTACLAVAGLLATAATLVSGRPRRLPWVSRTGTAAVTLAFAVRGVAGLAGRTDLLSPGATSERFRRMDRRFYAPLCLAIAALAAPGAARRRADRRLGVGSRQA